MRGTALLNQEPPTAFRASVQGNLDALRQAFRAGEATGDVDILVAVFDLEDSEVAFGNTQKQTLEKGAFRAWIKAGGLERISGFIDHGDAIWTGTHRSALKIGKLNSAEETDEGLLLHTSYNLDKTVSREAYSDLLHHPEGVQFSFGWDKRSEKTELRQGREFVTELWLTEWSQVGFGAQREAGLVSARGKDPGMRTRNLMEIPSKVMRAFYGQGKSLASALGSEYVYLAEDSVFADDDGERAGYVVGATSEGEFLKIRWAFDDEDEVAFDTTEVEEMEREWVPAKRAAMDPIAVRAALRDATFREAVAPFFEHPESMPIDPVDAFYRQGLEQVKEAAPRANA